MKTSKLKKVLLSVGSFLFATCLGFGFGLVKKPVVAEPLTTKNGFTDLDTSFAGTKGVTVGAVADSYLVVNKAYGGGNGINVDFEVDVTLTDYMYGAMMGFVPTNNKADIAVANKTGNGFADSNYVYYWHNGTGYEWTTHVNNTPGEGLTSSVQAPIIGNVKIKLSIAAYGNYTMKLYVPSSNTQMDASVARDEWVDLGSSQWWPFIKYEVSGRNGSDAVGYPFLSIPNAVYNSISLTSGQYCAVSSFNDNLSDPTAFANNYVTNDAFDNAVTTGTITVPRSTISVNNSTTADITTNHGTMADMFRSVQSFKGAMRAEMSLNSIGPTASLGFYSLTQNNNVLVTMSLYGMTVSKYGKPVYSEWENENKWATILNEAGVASLGGDFKIIMECNAQGDTTISLQVVQQTWGQKLTKQLYEITTKEGLLADVVTGGGYLVAAASKDAWNNVTTLKDIKLTGANGEVLLEDDFSYSNFNGDGENLWLLSDSTNMYNLPGVSSMVFSGGTAYVNTQNTATAKEKLTIDWNAQVFSGEMNYYLGMDEKDSSTASAYVTVKDGNLTLTQDTTVTLASNVDFTQKTAVQLVFNNANNKVYAYVNGTETGVANIKTDLTGYMGIGATNASLMYFKADVSDAFSVIEMQKGAYLKANTTLENSGIRFATIIDKGWYDEKQADATVSAITYGTLIVPTDYLSEVGNFTIEGLEASGKNYINAVVSNGFTNEDTATEDGYYQFMGGIKNILPANYTRNFSAVGYVTVTYNSGADTETFYSAYSEVDHSRNIYQLADRTYADRTNGETETYKYQLNDGTWAKYSQEVMNVMYAYLDGVVNVTVSEDGTVSNVELNEYYQASYQVTHDGNAFSVVSDTEVKTVLVNGIRQKNFTKGMNGDKYTATFTYAGIFNTEELFAKQTEVTEVSLAGLSAYPNITAYTYKSVAYGDLAETQPFMAVGVPDSKIPMPEGGYPAIVLVHGGAGQVFCEWIKLWTDKGYVALALDMFANKLDGTLAKVENSLAGPNESHSGSINDNPYDYQNSWVYHSVTNVILCHNYLRSLSNVNANKIGITGISWGGFITNIVSGVDSRFSAFAPVYGSGYIYDDTKWNGAFGNEDRQAWINRFDPSSYVQYNNKPTLYVSGIDDNCFDVTNRAKTYALAKGNVYYSQRSDLAHGYYYNQTEEIYYFMEKVLNGVEDSVTGFIDSTVSVSGTYVSVKINNFEAIKDKLSSINFVYTTSTDEDPHNWTFTANQVDITETGEMGVDLVAEGITGVKAFAFEFVMNTGTYRLSTEIVLV